MGMVESEDGRDCGWSRVWMVESVDGREWGWSRVGQL